MAKSTASRAKRKPAKQKPQKPYPEFPLFAHATGRWCKKIAGQHRYFGSWNDSDGALQRYIDLREGRTPAVTSDALTIRDLCNKFLAAKRHQLDTRDIVQRTFNDYHGVCSRIVKAFGKKKLVDDLTVDDFQKLRASIGKTWGPVALGNEVQRVRVVFKYAYDAALIDTPMRYGPTFKRPSKRVLRRERNGSAPRMFESKELRALLDDAGVQLQAMILLGINCGFGQSDIANLPQRCIDFDAAVADYPRPKTSVQRRCPLWPETIKALRETIARRPDPKDEADSDLVFITSYGNRWVRTTSGADETKRGVSIDAVAQEFSKLMTDLDIKRDRLNFYALRHTFETIAGESRDQVAVDHIMGHADSSMSAVYRERISDERLQAVVDHVHAWLFPKKKKK